jgi:AraC-like DNA-binding protein
VSIRPSAASATAVAELSIYDCERDARGVAIPRPHVSIVVRFGASTPRGIDAFAFGPRRTAHRKALRSGQRALIARLNLGAQQALLGVPASAIGGRVVPLEDLWGRSDTTALLERLASASTTQQAATLLDAAIAERLSRTPPSRAHSALATEAAARLKQAPLTLVAKDLGISERHLRRVFREVIGVGPKEYVKLTRFHHALRAARVASVDSWASIAAGAGYYDQAHLIADFKSIAGVTPRAFLGELHGATWLV